MQNKLNKTKMYIKRMYSKMIHKTIVAKVH